MCGLFGFIGKKKCPVDFRTLLTLGINNDSRGGDSCGIFIDGQVEYGVDKNKLFYNFYENSKLLAETNSAKVIIGHCRKTSVGKTSLETAQPVVIYNKDTGDIEFVTIHNGTISNYKELANKYLSKYDDKMTDSQVIANIVYTHGFDVLSEYIGSGAFVFVDYRTPKRVPSVFFFKGKSMESKWTKKLTEERPLYYICTDEGLWFSSICDFLYPLEYKTKSTVYTFPTNLVTIVQNNTLYEVEKIDREKQYQKDYSYGTSYYPSNYTYGYSQNQSSGSYSYGSINYNPYEDYDFVDYESSVKASSPTPTEKKEKTLATEDINRVILCEDNRYYFNNVLCNGGYNLDPLGYIDVSGKTYYFYNGILVYGKNIYCMLTQIQHDYMKCTKEAFLQEFYELVFSYSPMFLTIKEPADDKEYYYTFNNAVANLITGPMVLPFTREPNIVYYSGGLVNKVKQSTNSYIMKKFIKHYFHMCNKYDNMHQEALFDEMNLI